MSLIRRVFFRRSVLSVLLTAAVITLLVFAGPRAAQALTITVSNPASGTLGSNYSFTVTINVEDVKDLLPIDHIDLQIYKQGGPNSVEYNNLPLPAGPNTNANKVYYQAGGTLNVTGTSGDNWGEADSGVADRYGYGYVEGSGWGTENFIPGYGYGYVNGGDHIGPTSITYSITWTSPASWPVGIYEIKVLVYGNGTTAFTHQTSYTFTLSTAGGGGGGGGGGGMVGVLAFGFIIDTQGRISVEARCIGENAEAYLILDSGTYCLLDGAPLVFIYMRPVPDEQVPSPTPYNGRFVTRCFTLGPENANFSPPISLIFNFDPTRIPNGFNEEDIYIAKWDDQLQQWIKQQSYVNQDDNKVSCLVSTFSNYAVIAVPPSEPEPEPVTTPPPTTEPEPVITVPPTTEPEPEPEPEPVTPPVATTEPEPEKEPTTVPPVVAPVNISESKGISQWVLAGSVFGGAVLIILLAVYLFWYRKILE